MTSAWNWAALSQKPAAESEGGDCAVPTRRGTLLNGPRVTVSEPSVERSQRPQGPKEHRSHKRNANDDAVEGFSKLRIVNRAVSAEQLREEMNGRRFIPLATMDRVPRDTFTDSELDWVTIGVLARKTMSKPATNGSTFMVWGLADLEGTELGVFLFGDAYNSHWKQMEGSIVAVLNATLMPATEKNKFAFKVSRPEEVVKLGVAVDFGICKGTTASESRCRLAVNTAKSQFCLHHIAANFTKAGHGRQQLNNALGNIRKSLFTAANQPKNISAGVYTSRSAMSPAVAASGWNPLPSSLNRKRKRAIGATNGSAGILGVPTVLSATGSVLQKTAPNHPSASASSRRAKQPGDLLGRLRNSSATGSGQSSASGPPKRVSRGEKLVSLVAAANGNPVGASVLKRPKTKKVDMIRFMNTGSKS